MEEASLGSIIIKYLLAFLMIIIILISVLGKSTADDRNEKEE